MSGDRDNIWPSAAKPQPKEFNRGFHGFHGLEMVSELTTLIRVIRVIRGKSSRNCVTLTDRSGYANLAGKRRKLKFRSAFALRASPFVKTTADKTAGRPALPGAAACKPALPGIAILTIATLPIKRGLSMGKCDFGKKRICPQITQIHADTSSRFEQERREPSAARPQPKGIEPRISRISRMKTLHFAFCILHHPHPRTYPPSAVKIFAKRSDSGRLQLPYIVFPSAPSALSRSKILHLHSSVICGQFWIRLRLPALGNPRSTLLL